MKKIRGTVALIVSLALAGLAAYGVYGYLNKPKKEPEPAPPPAVEEKEQSPPPEKTLSEQIEPGMRAVTIAVDNVTGGSRKLVAGDRVDVLAVVSTPDLPEGRVSHPLLTNARVMAVNIDGSTGGRKAREWTVTLAVTASDAAAVASADPAATLQLLIRNPEDNGEASPFTTAFSPAGGAGLFSPPRRDLSALIPPGMRAITLNVSPTDGVGGVFRPGDRIDVVATCPYGNASLTTPDQPGGKSIITGTHRNSKILLQDIPVIATDRSLSWGTDTDRSVSRVTLAVTPEDAEKLTVLADSKKGRSVMRLICRNTGDHQTADTRGAELLDLITDRRPYMRVDLIHGSTRTDQMFYR